MNSLKARIMEYNIPEVLRSINFYPYFRALESINDSEVKINGRKYIMFGSNNYLGLTNHPKVVEAAKKALYKYGTACAGSRVLNGTLDLHDELERKLAALVGKEAAICFNSGFQTNSGILSILAGKNDYIILDELIHASIIDGSRLSYSKVFKFAHNDYKSLELKLKVCDSNMPKLIIVEGIYSMDGDTVNLPEVVKLAKKYDAAVMIDDAHAIGVIGENGAGTVNKYGLTNDVDIIVGTLSKSLASLGGFVAADFTYINCLKHSTRPMIFSASITPAATASAIAAIDILKKENYRIKQVNENAEYLRKGLKAEGFNTGNSETHIIPIILYDDYKTILMAQMLYEEGIFVNPVMTPAVPKGKSRIRISVSATHTKKHLDKLIENVTQINQKLEANFSFEMNEKAEQNIA
jgi:8-amino-7-oxononanoate synthase